MKKKREVVKKSAPDIYSPKNYARLLEQIKTDIFQTQLRAALSVTKELIMLYWRIGKTLSKKTREEGWGAKPLDRLSRDLKNGFPDIQGFSLRNLQYMRKFAEGYPDANYAAAAAQIPWGHNMILLDKVEDSAQRLRNRDDGGRCGYRLQLLKSRLWHLFYD